MCGVARNGVEGGSLPCFGDPRLPRGDFTPDAPSSSAQIPPLYPSGQEGERHSGGMLGKMGSGLSWSQLPV